MSPSTLGSLCSRPTQLIAGITNNNSHVETDAHRVIPYPFEAPLEEKPFKTRATNLSLLSLRGSLSGTKNDFWEESSGEPLSRKPLGSPTSTASFSSQHRRHSYQTDVQSVALEHTHSASARSDRSTFFWSGLQNSTCYPQEPLSMHEGLTAYARSLNLPLDGGPNDFNLGEEYARSVHLGDGSSSKGNRVVKFGSNPTRTNTTSTGGHSNDPESAYHQGILKGRKEKAQGYEAWKLWWGDKQAWERRVIVFSILATFLVLATMVILLAVSESKKMGRGSLTGAVGVSTVFVAAGMWAGNRSAVETLMAVNLFAVWGIFLTSQVDVFMTA